MAGKDKYQIHEYNFSSFDAGSEEGVEAYKLKNFDLNEFPRDSIPEKVVPEKVIRREREAEQNSAFAISSIVKKSRGLIKQEQQDYQQRIHDAVEKRVSELQETAFQQGYDAGVEKGYEDALQEAMAKYEDQISSFQEMIAQVVSYKDDLFEVQRQDIFKMVKALGKWVVNREIRNDQYIADLLEKMILELHARSDLLIKVNADNYENMPKILELIQKKIGQLSNVRVEVSGDMKAPGLVVESSNGMIDGSLEAQFLSIDRVFESIGIE